MFRDTILSGGNRGPAIKPGSPDESLLVRAIEHSGELKMPPGRKLRPDEIAGIRRWIELGAALASLCTTQYKMAAGPILAPQSDGAEILRGYARVFTRCPNDERLVTFSLEADMGVPNGEIPADYIL